MFYGLDPLYLVMSLPALALALFASFMTKSTFAKYSQVPSGRGLSGAEAAAMMLRQSGVSGVEVERVPGSLTDHYDPGSKTLRLSESVYESRSLAAVGVACHEAGHALQHAQGYAALKLRTALVPATNFGSKAAYIFILLGFFMSAPKLIGVGAVLFSAAVLFSLVTLPVEWDASRRAKAVMVSGGLVTAEEAQGAAKVLNAAFLTYVAAAISAIMTLLYYLIRAGLLGGRRDH